MNKTLGLQLIGYGLLLAGLSYLTHHLAPALARPTLIAGLMGGVLCLVWGLRMVAGSRGKALPILTLVPVNYVLLSQALLTWAGGTQEVPGRQMAAAVMTLLLVISIAMLMRIGYAGVVFERQAANPTKGGESTIPPAGKPAAQANAGKRA